MVPKYNSLSIHKLLQSNCAELFSENFYEIQAVSRPGNQMVVANAEYVEDHYVLMENLLAENITLVEI